MIVRRTQCVIFRTTRIIVRCNRDSVSPSLPTRSRKFRISRRRKISYVIFFLHLIFKPSTHIHKQILLEEESRAPDGAIKKFEPQGLKVSSLTVQAEEGKQAKVVLESGTGAPFSLRVSEDTFSVTKGEDLDVLTVNPDGDVVAKTTVLAAGSLSSDKGLIVNDVPQWTLAGKILVPVTVNSF